MSKFTYLAMSESGKPTTFAQKPLHVVHKGEKGYTYTVEAFNDDVSASEDAKNRTERAKKLGLSCTYEVLSREEGEGKG
jgi:hypothetical protein